MQKPTLATGRRKTSTARVILSAPTESEAQIQINGRTMEDFFPLPMLQRKVMRPLEITERVGKYSLRVSVNGGGTSGQAGAVAHGISRALEKIEPTLRPVLKKDGLLTRDPRVVERKKPGKHKARKSTQFSKR